MKKLCMSENDGMILDFNKPLELYSNLLRLQEDSGIQRFLTDENFPIWLVTRASYAQQILKDHRVVKDPARVNPSRQRECLSATPTDTSINVIRRLHMLAKDPPEHTRIRALANPLFTAESVLQMRPMVTAIANGLIDKFIDSRRCDFLLQYATHLPLLVITALLDLPAEDTKKLQEWSDVLIEVNVTTDNKAQMEKAADEFICYLKKAVDSRRRNPGNDFISLLYIQGILTHTISEEVLYAMIFLLIIGGHETTINLLANVVLALLSDQRQFSYLKEHPERIAAVAEELIRFCGPVLTSTLRLAAEDITVGGKVIPKGEGILVVLSAANMDESYYRSARELNLENPGRKHLGFGYGPHYCVGAPLARLELEVTLELVLSRLPNLRLGVLPEEIPWKASTFVRGITSLPVCF